jgi:hypothetical protein
METQFPALPVSEWNHNTEELVSAVPMTSSRDSHIDYKSSERMCMATLIEWELRNVDRYFLVLLWKQFLYLRL